MNICDPILSIVTSIAVDHINQLGNTPYSIALDKSHIIKPKVPCVLGPFCEPFEPFTTRAHEMDS